MGHGATVPQASGSVCPNASAPGSGCTPGPLHSPRPTLNGCYWRNLGASWSTSPLFFHTIWVTLAFGAWPSGGPGAPLEQPPELGLGQGRAQLRQPPAIVSDNVRTSPWGRAPLCTQREASRARSSVWRRPLTVSPVCPLATPSLSLLGAGVLSPWDWGVLAGAPRSRRPCCVSGAAPGSPKPRSPRAAPGCSGSQCPLVTAGTAAGKSHPRDRGAGGLVWGWGKTSHKGEELQLIQQDLRRAPAATLPWARTSHSRPGCSSPVGHPQLLQLLITPPPTPARRFLLLSNLNAPSFS